MTALLLRQVAFARKMATLKYWMLEMGIVWKTGRGLCCEECSKETSLHRLSLAEDLLVFRDGQYCECKGERAVEDILLFTKIGEQWELLGGSWGGRWDDYNHFSLSWGGYK